MCFLITKTACNKSNKNISKAKIFTLLLIELVFDCLNRKGIKGFSVGSACRYHTKNTVSRFVEEIFLKKNDLLNLLS